MVAGGLTVGEAVVTEVSVGVVTETGSNVDRIFVARSSKRCLSSNLVGVINSLSNLIGESLSRGIW